MLAGFWGSINSVSVERFCFLPVCFFALVSCWAALLGLIFSDSKSLILVNLKFYQESQLIQILLVSYKSFALRHTEVFGSLLLILL